MNKCKLFKNESNTFYLSGYKNADSIIILADKKYYFTDARYLLEVKERLADFEIVPISGNIDGFVADFAAKCGFESIEIESDLPYSFATELCRKNPSLTLSISDNYISALRSVKTAAELAVIEESQRVTDKTFTEILPLIRENMTEIELAHLLESLLYKNGADDLAFSSIVAFGENTAKPHAHRSERRLKNGEFVTLDFGAKVKGYCSDMTRTVCFGTPTGEMKKIYSVVSKAQSNALEKLSAAYTGDRAHNLAVEVFSRYGLERYFTHSLGHGIGIDIHEKPNLSPSNKEKLFANAVVSVEPGLYIDGKFGVRIEDMVILQDNGVKNLTNSEKQLIIL